jgi:glucose-6-phosphate 1-dehydrogenase
MPGVLLPGHDRNRGPARGSPAQTVTCLAAGRDKCGDGVTHGHGDRPVTHDPPLVPPNHVIVVFGANGDLARRKLLPSFFHLHEEGLMPKDYRIVGTSRSGMSDDEFREFARAAVKEFSRSHLPEDIWRDFARRLSYVSATFGTDTTAPVEEAVHAADAEMTAAPQRLFYLAVPSSAFADITQGLAKSGLVDGGRVIFEKPFGSDLKSFQELNNTVRSCLDDSQVYRIDHFLGKETVQNILALRFANGMFEPVWNRSHIDHIQIDAPETIGIGSRAAFYESTGALRDMVVTHLFQVLSFVALEPPPTFTPKALMDEVAKVFESIAPLRRDDVVFGQYNGYREEEGVAADSTTETFAAARVAIDNWRWSGIPFFLRTGKRMPDRRSAVTLVFREPPRRMFVEAGHDTLDRDHLTIDLGPDEGITISFLAKVPGPLIELDEAQMTFRYEGSFGSDLIGPYEQLLHDALMGDRTLFTRADGIERTWELVHPVLDNRPRVHPYAPGSWGPQEAFDLIAPRRWHLPREH